MSNRRFPDPLKTVCVGHRPIFCQTTDHWLPDSSVAETVVERPLDSQFDLTNLPIRPAPPDAPYGATEAEIAAQSGLIAVWVYETYCLLVGHRIKAYNHYRQMINKGDSSLGTLGRYKLACRLACEQILRRDLPAIMGFDWGFHEPALPIYELIIKFKLSPSENEIVRIANIHGVVEVRQHRFPPPRPGFVVQTQPDWSSSSSSSSESDIDPG